MGGRRVRKFVGKLYGGYPAQSVWPALMIAPLLGAVTWISIHPSGRAPKLQFTSTHQFEFWGYPRGA